MPINNFEIAFRGAVSALDLQNQLACFLKIPIANIVDFDNYWNLNETRQKLLVGISIDYSACGLKTLLRGMCFFPLKDEQMGNLASDFATRLNMKVVIGDYTYPNPRAQDRSLVYFPNGSCARAIASWDRFNDANDIELVPFGLK